MNNHKLVVLHKISKQDTPVTSSITVAEYFEKRHDNVLQNIDNLITENSGVKSWFIESTRKVRGREFREVLMTEEGFSLVVMGFTGAKALQFKVAYINAFMEMRRELTSKHMARELTRNGYKGVSSALKEHLGSEAKPYHFSNEADMRNVIVLNLTSKQYKNIYGIEGDMRDHLSAHELEALADLEKYDEMLINMGLSYAERKERCEEYHLRTLQKRLSA